MSKLNQSSIFLFKHSQYTKSSNPIELNKRSSSIRIYNLNFFSPGWKMKISLSPSKILANSHICLWYHNWSLTNKINRTSTKSQCFRGNSRCYFIFELIRKKTESCGFRKWVGAWLLLFVIKLQSILCSIVLFFFF